MAEPKFKYSSRQWYPMKLGEALYRCPEGESIYWPVPDDDSNKVMAVAKSYASRLGFKVVCKVGKMVIEGPDGKDVVRRVVVMTPQGNPRAAEYAAAIREGREPPGADPDTPEAAEAFYASAKDKQPPKRRGRPPVIKSEEDQKKWEEEWARRDAEKKIDT